MNRPLRIAAIATVATSVALSLGAVGVAAPGHLGKAAAAPPAGVYVAHEPVIATNTEPSAYAVDGQNYEHFVQFRRIGGGHSAHLVYYSKKLHAKTWIKHTAPGTWNISGQPRLEITLYPSTGDFFVVAYTCSGVFAAEAGHASARLPQFTKVTGASDCAASAGPQDLSAEWRDLGSSESLHVIVPDATTAGQWDVMSGLPGTPFTQAAIVPGDHAFVPTQLESPYRSYDRTTGVVVGHGIASNGHRAIYETSEFSDYNSTDEKYEETFSALTNLASLGSASKDYTVESLDYSGSTIQLGLYIPAGTIPNQKTTLYNDQRDSNGQWTTPIPVPHTGLNDRNLIFTTSTATGKLRATWERSIGSPASARTAKSGIITQRRVNDTWTDRVVESNWWKDTLLSVTYDSTGLPHFFYLQQK